MEKGNLSRRGFLERSTGTLAAAGLPVWYASRVVADEQENDAKTRKRIGPNDQIVMGAIGVGGQGTYIMKAAMKQPGIRYVAVCDVDANRVKKGAEEVIKDQKGGDCATYADFRELLDRKDINAVTIGTATTGTP